MEEEITITIHPFRMGTDKEAALKPLEEASEVREAAQRYCVAKSVHTTANWQSDERWRHTQRIADLKEALTDEIADCIQASVNLAARYGIDLPAAMLRCEERNRKRGRYGD